MSLFFQSLCDYLEYDPSHPVSMMMDYIEPIYEFKHKIFHIHLKDTEILVDNLKRNGIFEPHIFQFRLPGYGDIDWDLFFDSLSKINYKGDANIECCKDPNIPNHDELVSLKHAKENLITVITKVVIIASGINVSEK